MTIVATAGSSVILSIQIPDGSTGLFPRARIYDSAGSEVAGSPVSLTHTALGLYQGNFTTPGTPGMFVVNITNYTDAGHTIVDTVNGASTDAIQTAAGSGDPAATVAAAVWNEVITNSGTADGTYGAVMKILGAFSGANAVVDNYTYDANGLLTAVRLRVFANNAAATAATDGGTGEGELFTASLTATADGTFAALPGFIKGLVT